jgi:hypothetical protein
VLLWESLLYASGALGEGCGREICDQVDVSVIRDVRITLDERNEDEER